MFRSTPPCKCQFAAGYLHRQGNEVFGAVQLEVIHLHSNRKFGNGVAQHQRILKLPLLVGGRELTEQLARIVTLAVRQLGGSISVEGDPDAAKLTVKRHFRTVISNDVVTRNGLFGLNDSE